jgi:3-dehydroquinate dehydratase
MADVKQTLNKIEAKLRMLEFTRSDTPRIQEKNELKSSERQEKVFSELIDSIHEPKILVQTVKIEQGENPENVTHWKLEIEEKIAKYEQVMAELHGNVEKLQAKAREEDELREDNKRKQRSKEELKLEKAKMQMKHVT